MRMKIDQGIKALASIFRENGFSLYLVGGAVRDFLLKKENNDYDFTTDAEPKDIKAMFHRTIDTGIKHGTVTVLFKGAQYEITTFRAESDYHDSRHPDSVRFIKSLDEDLARRDFTINTFASSLPEGKIIDLHDGMKDLRHHIIRAIGNPDERFHEDALRMMRACRFSSQLDFTIEEKTLEAIKNNSHSIIHVSAERIKEELWRLINGQNPIKGLEAMRVTGLMDEILPELSAAVGFEQGGMHRETLYEHLLLALDSARKHGYPMEVKLASLFHDIGKVPTREKGDGREYTFYRHDTVSAEMTDKIFRRLKTSNEERERTVHLIRNHMFAYTPDWSDSAVRRFINRIGVDEINNLFYLRICDGESTVGHSFSPAMILALSERINAELDKNNALSMKDLRINGKRLTEIGIKPGPEMGRILQNLLDEVIDDPSRNTEEYLEKEALRISQSQER